jgi:hypothetical protein
VAEPGELGLEAGILGHELAEVGGKARIVHAQQHVALAHAIARLDEYLLDDAAFEALDQLVAPGRDDAALAARDLVELRPTGPGDAGREHGDDDDEQQRDPARGPAMHGGVIFGCELKVGSVLPGHGADTALLAPIVAQASASSYGLRSAGSISLDLTQGGSRRNIECSLFPCVFLLSLDQEMAR